MKFNDNEPEVASFQLAPMIDIVFLLLIFFIVTWNVSKQEMETNKEIKLPSSSEGAATNSYEHAIVIEVFRDGKLQIGKKVFTMAEIKEQMDQTQRVSPDKPITIWADKEVTVQQAFEVFDLCKSEGLNNVSIAAKKSE
jgi:biopolymer transport protein ExbD